MVQLKIIINWILLVPKITFRNRLVGHMTWLACRPYVALVLEISTPPLRHVLGPWNSSCRPRSQAAWTCRQKEQGGKERGYIPHFLEMLLAIMQCHLEVGWTESLIYANSSTLSKSWGISLADWHFFVSIGFNYTVSYQHRLPLVILSHVAYSDQLTLMSRLIPPPVYKQKLKNSKLLNWNKASFNKKNIVQFPNHWQCYGSSAKPPVLLKM